MSKYLHKFFKKLLQISSYWEKIHKKPIFVYSGHCQCQILQPLVHLCIYHHYPHCLRLLTSPRNESSVHYILPSLLHPCCNGEDNLTKAISQDFHNQVYHQRTLKRDKMKRSMTCFNNCCRKAHWLCMLKNSQFYLK